MSDGYTPVPFVWDHGMECCPDCGSILPNAAEPVMRPAPGFLKRCAEMFVIGQRYVMEALEERSMRSHRHYFALIREAWENLPDEKVERYPTPEHLRKHALIRTGYRQERQFVCSSKAEAQRVAAFIDPMDLYSLVTFREQVVTVYTARSQSTRAMGKDEFQLSKDAVIGWIAQELKVSPEALSRARQG